MPRGSLIEAIADGTEHRGQFLNCAESAEHFPDTPAWITRPITQLARARVFRNHGSE